MSRYHAQFRKYIQQKKYITSDTNSANYQFLPGGGNPALKLCVPEEDEEEFLTNYYNIYVKNNVRVSLMERPHKEHNQFRMDLDFKTLNKSKKKVEDLTHTYDMNEIYKLLELYTDKLNQYIELPKKGLNFYIFEKNHPTILTINSGGKEVECIKDGLHVLCPDIVVDNRILLTAYNDIVTCHKAKEIVDTFESSEDITDIIDKSVICRNSWILYGGGKSSYEVDNFYKLSTIYNVEIHNGRITTKIKENKLNMLEQIIHYSNYNKKLNTEIRDEIDVDQIFNVISYKKKKTVFNEIDKVKLNNNTKFKSKDVSLKYIGHILSCLSLKRVNTYETWFDVGVCLRNISPMLRAVFVKWSSQSPKFDENETLKCWEENMAKYGSKYTLGITQLKRYASEDNPEKFYKLMNIEKQKHIDTIISNISNQKSLSNKKNAKKFIGPLSLAKDIKNYIKFHCPFEMICANNTKSGTWYKFEDGIWSEDSGANKLHKLFSRELSPALKNTHEYWFKRRFDIDRTNRMISDTDSEISVDINNILEDNDATYTPGNIINARIEKEAIEDKIRTIVQLDEFIEMNANRNNIIKDLTQECYDSEFFTQLDENRNIFACGNGYVLDLKECNVRRGLPEDMCSIRTNIEYPFNIETEEAMEKMNIVYDLLDKIYPDIDVQEHVLNVFAESLSGVQRREKFIIHTGSGGNGKSVIFDLLHLVFGKYSLSPDATIFTFSMDNPNAPNPVIAGCKGRRLIDTNEPKSNKPFNVAGIKKMTGGDSLTGRHLNNEPIHFKPQATWHTCTNDIPKFDGASDGGIERRLEIIHYASSFLAAGDPRLADPEKYPNCFVRDEKFRDEEFLKELAPYLLRVLFERYCELHKNQFHDLLEEDKIPECIKKYTNDYLKSSNVTDQFINSQIVERNGYRQSEKEIYNEFKKFANDSLIKPLPKDEFKRLFERRLQIKTRKAKGVTYYYDYVIENCGEPY